MCRKKQKSDSNRCVSFWPWISNVIDTITMLLRRLWYIILLCISTPYVILNFEEIVQFQFFTEFNGKNLIFLVWIILLIIPLFDSFEGFGITIKRAQQYLENKQLDALVENEEIPSQKELQKQLKDESK